MPNWLSMAKHEQGLHFLKLFMKTLLPESLTEWSELFSKPTRFMWLCWTKMFYISNPERFFSSLKKTIVLYLVKKFETFMLTFTSGRRCVFFKKRFFISASATIHLILNLQAGYYRNINYYNIYTCSFTQYYLSMLRNNKKNLKLFITAFRFILRCLEK